MRSYGHGWNGAHVNGATVEAPRVRVPEYIVNPREVKPERYGDARVDVLAKAMTKGWPNLTESSRNVLRRNAASVLRDLDAVATPKAACTTQARVVQSAPMVRTPDYDTSTEGANKAAQSKEKMHSQLLAAFYGAGPAGFTDEEAAEAAGLQDSCYWKRAGELRQKGLIKPTGERRKGRKGVARMVSRFVEEKGK